MNSLMFLCIYENIYVCISHQDVVLWTAAVLMCISLWILLYACYLDRLMYLRSQLYAANRGYVTIETQESGTCA